jgi:hypothetical protein
MRIATGEVDDVTLDSEGKVAARKGGLKGGKARANALTVPPFLWCVSVGLSGHGKSPGADAILRDVAPSAGCPSAGVAKITGHAYIL